MFRTRCTGVESRELQSKMRRRSSGNGRWKREIAWLEKLELLAWNLWSDTLTVFGRSRTEEAFEKLSCSLLALLRILVGIEVDAFSNCTYDVIGLEHEIA